MLVIGAGGAGLVSALAAAEAGARVQVVCQSPLGQGSSTAVSGGGFMMSTPQFPVEDHIRMTLEAGRHLNDPALVRILCEEANDARRWLERKLGMAFNLKDNGQGYWFTRGGAGFFEQLTKQMRVAPNIQLIEQVTVVRLLMQDGICVGALGVSVDGGSVQFDARATILATGGYAGLYARHDNPGTPVGEGIFLALAAGVQVRDLEFVQFYPLGIAEPTLPTFMAFRPFPPQAKVINSSGESLTEKHLDTDDLNEAVGTHRDALSLAIEAEAHSGPVRLDLTRVDWSQKKRWFSLQFLERYDFPWQEQPARVYPIAHHSMGGILVDEHGASTVPHLYAVGEAASGLHGANRLGSNSLTACLVFGRRAGIHAAQARRSHESSGSPIEKFFVAPPDATKFEALQQLCWDHLGMRRNGEGLQAALAALDQLKEFSAPCFKMKCALQIAQTVAAFALKRRESRGAHCRTDWPQEAPDQQRSAFATLTANGLLFVNGSDSPR